VGTEALSKENQKMFKTVSNETQKMFDKMPRQLKEEREKEE